MSMEFQDDLRRAKEAAEWLLRLQSEGRACHAAFFDWMMGSPQHVREFLAVSKVSRRLDQIDPERVIDVDKLVRQMRAAVVPFPSISELSTPPNRPAARSTWRWAAGLAASALIFSFIAAIWFGPTRATLNFATGLGEQRSSKLPDGSVVHLNATSQIEVNFTDTVRQVRLVRGEALFAVEHDPTRPFQVAAGTVMVQALGTQFDVNRHDQGTVVSVIEGQVAVAVSGSGSAAPATVLKGGEQVSIEGPGSIQKRQLTDASQPVAWRERRLVFQDATLEDVASEFNRYNVPRFALEGAGVRRKRISGVFGADHPQALLLYLQRDETLSVETRGDAVVIRPR